MQKGDLVVYKYARELGVFYAVSVQYNEIYRSNIYKIKDVVSGVIVSAGDYSICPATPLEVMEFICERVI